jgi:hypothetical protein
MGKRASRVSKQKSARHREGMRSSPADAPAPPQVDLARLTHPPRRLGPVLLGAVLAAALLAALAGFWAHSRNLASRDAPNPEAALPEVRVEGQGLCEQFMALKNAGDPAAGGLLGRLPVVPDAPQSRAEVDRLQTDFFLREKLRIVRVEVEGRQQGHRRAAPTGRLVLVTRGNVSAPTIALQTSNGVERSQRTMSNPDLVVEVRDGKIYGVRSELYMGP